MMRHARVLVIAGAVALCVVTTAGCTGEPPKGPVSPGVEFAALGGAEVVGFLIDADGVWTVVDVDPEAADAPEPPKVLATLAPGSVDEGGIEALDGRYVWAAGRSSDGEDDVPQIRVDAIDTAVEPDRSTAGE